MTWSRIRPLGLIAACALVMGTFGALSTVPAGAADTIVVTTTADGGGGSLRDAFATASTDGVDTIIELQAGATYALTCGGGGQLEHTENNVLELAGNGATIEQTCAGERVIDQQGTSGIRLTDLTITGGNTPSDGGGVNASGPVTATRVSFAGNSSGTIDAVGDVLLVQSTVSGSSHQDGIIVRTQPGNVKLINSTVTGNSSPTNAIVGASGGVFVVYSTITDNLGTEVLRSANTGDSLPLAIELFGSVVLASTDGAPACSIDTGADPTSHGYNFSDDDSCNLVSTGDTQGAGNDPLLNAPAANGGLAPTQLPQAASPLLDRIPVAACQADGAAGVTTDERGVSRPQGAGCDIGAVEVEVPVPPAPPEPLPVPPRFTG